jgi:hypothetical protein
MERLLNLPSGLRVHRNSLMLDFRHENIRYRVSTVFVAENGNIAKASKLLASIKLDLERGLNDGLPRIYFSEVDFEIVANDFTRLSNIRH